MANASSEFSTVQEADNASWTGLGHGAMEGDYPGGQGSHPVMPVFPPKPLYQFVLKVAFCGVVLLITLVGNALVLVAFCTTRKLRTYTNYYLVGLAVADLISGGITPAAMNLTWFVGFWPLGPAACLAFVYVNLVFVHATFLLTFIICVDRYRAMKMPLKHLQEKNRRHALKMILPCFVLPVLIWSVPVLILPRYNLFRPLGRYTCHLPYVSNRILLLASSLILSWIPIFGISALYAAIYIRFIRNSPTFKGRGAGARSQEPNSASLIESVTATESDRNKANNGRATVDYTNHAFTPEEAPANKEGSDRSTAGPKSAPMPAVRRKHHDDDSDDNDSDYEEEERRRAARARSKSTGNRSIRGGVGRATGLPDAKQQKRLTSSRRATRTLAYIIAVMVVSGTPWIFYSIIRTLMPSVKMSPLVTWIVGYAVHISSATNPFCYAICNPIFKKAFLRILFGHCGRRKPKRKK